MELTDFLGFRISAAWQFACIPQSQLPMCVVDIFARLPDGSPMWIASVDSLGQYANESSGAVFGVPARKGEMACRACSSPLADAGLSSRFEQVDWFEAELDFDCQLIAQPELGSLHKRGLRHVLDIFCDFLQLVVGRGRDRFDFTRIRPPPAGACSGSYSNPAASSRKEVSRLKKVSGNDW